MINTEHEDDDFNKYVAKMIKLAHEIKDKPYNDSPTELYSRPLSCIQICNCKECPSTSTQFAMDDSANITMNDIDELIVQGWDHEKSTAIIEDPDPDAINAILASIQDVVAINEPLSEISTDVVIDVCDSSSISEGSTTSKYYEDNRREEQLAYSKALTNCAILSDVAHWFQENESTFHFSFLLSRVEDLPVKGIVLHITVESGLRKNSSNSFRQTWIYRTKDCLFEANGYSGESPITASRVALSLLYKLIVTHTHDSYQPNIINAVASYDSTSSATPSPASEPGLPAPLPRVKWASLFQRTNTAKLPAANTRTVPTTTELSLMPTDNTHSKDSNLTTLAEIALNDPWHFPPQAPTLTASKDDHSYLRNSI